MQPPFRGYPERAAFFKAVIVKAGTDNNSRYPCRTDEAGAEARGDRNRSREANRCNGTSSLFEESPQFHSRESRNFRFPACIKARDRGKRLIRPFRLLDLFFR